MDDRTLLEFVNDVYPCPKEVEVMRSSGLKASPEIPGHINPVHEGMYLRYFEDYQDWAFSEWIVGKWTTDGFFESDIQNAPWMGGVRAAAEIGKEM